MRRVNINPFNTAEALKEIERASAENDILDISQNFTFSGTVSGTMVLNVGSPTVANCAQVLAQLLTIMQKGGLHRTT